MNRLLLVLFFITNFSSSLYSQTITVKIVSNEDLQPLSGVTVRVFTRDSVLNKVYSSDNEGIFSQVIPLKEFRLQLTYVGYKDMNLQVKNNTTKDIDFGTSVMFPDTAKMLKEITVMGKNILQDVDKMIVLPSVQQLKASSSGLDLLQHLQLPGLFVDPVQQKVTIAGTLEIIYRINGVNSTLNQIIALKADQIQRVEYSQIPSIREADMNSGFINIILKKDVTGTYLNTNVLGAVTTGFINGNANIKTIYGESEFAFDYSVNWRDYNERWSKESESYYFPNNDTLHFNKKGRKAPFGYLSQDINLSYTYNNIQNIFIFRFLNSIYNSFDKNYIDLYENSSHIPQLFRNIYSKSKNYTPSLDLYCIRKIEEKKGIEINLVGTLMNSDYNRKLIDTYQDLDDQYIYINNSSNGNKKSLIFESFYYNKKHTVKYNIGLKGKYSHTNNKYNNNDISKINQFSAYPYISVSGNIRNLSYTFGTGLQILYTKDDLISKNYYRNLTTFSLFYTKNESWNIRNVLRYTPSFPNLSYLNDIDQRQDSLMVIRGNPLIKPSQTISDNLNFTYQIKANIRMTLGMNASKTIDPIRNNYYFDQTINSFITQRNNQKREKEMAMSLDFNWNSILNIFNVSSRAAWNNYKSKGKDYSLHLNNFYWYIFCNVQIKNISIDAGYRKASKDIAGQVIYLNENYSSLGLSYKKKNLNLRGGIMFPFTYGTKYGTDIKSSAIQSAKNIYIRDNANMVYIGFSYNISWGKSVFKINKNLYNSDWDNGIIKVKDN